MADLNHICILRLSALGDCCHTLAVVRAVQDALPEAQLTWIVGSTEHQLLDGLDGVELIPFDKRQGSRAYSELARGLRHREFDVLLNMHASWRANRVSRAVRAPRRIGFDRARARDAQWLFTNERIAPQHRPHVIDGLFGFAERLGIRRDALRWDLPLSPADFEIADQHLAGERPVVLLSPCSSERARNFRNWPAERFAEVARHASAHHDAEVVITGSGTELEQHYARTITAAVPASHNLVGKTPLKSLAALIARANVIVSPDSGPAHIATAVGTPTIGLYATSNPGRTGPILRPELTLNAYPQALEQFLGRTVDDVRWGQRVRHPDAMTLIPTAAVTQRLDLVLAEKR